MIDLRALRLVGLAAGAVGGLSGAAYGLLNEQSRRARQVIGEPDAPHHADGVFLPDGTGPLPHAHVPPHMGRPLELGVVGDSSAAGLGVDEPGQLPGVLLGQGLAAESERPVALTTHAIVGSTSRDLEAQIDATLITPPDVVMIMIGANDVTTKLPVRGSAQLLADGVTRLRAADVSVVVGTCPDLGAIRPIPQPLRSLARTWSHALAREQRNAVTRAGGHPVPLADLLAPEFLAHPSELFSADRFHPSAAGYQAAVAVLLPAICDALGLWEGPPLPAAPQRSSAAEARRPTSRVVSALNNYLRRRE